MAMRPLVLGILNVTPDSFSDGGNYIDAESAIARASQMLEEGADMVDVGGESTRPGAAPITPSQELARVIPVIEAISRICRVSIDTRSEEVARAAVAAGASIINDVSASLWQAAADTGAGWIAVHMQGEPASMQAQPSYIDVVGEVKEFLVERAETANAGGVKDIWIDPGFGFGKTLEHNLELLVRLDEIVATGIPVAIGTSRKSMLGAMLAESDGSSEPTKADDRLEGSVGTATYAMVLGAQLIRVHDVKAGRQAATVVAAEEVVAEQETA
jgi:dihydropteroate synthase